MDTGLWHAGLMQGGLMALEPGAVLRLPDAAGHHVGVVRGSVWLTQHGEQRDWTLHAGESLRIERNGLTLIVPLGGAARVVLEDGLVAAPSAQAGASEAERSIDAVTRDPWLVHSPDFELAARRLRAEVIAAMLSGLARRLKAAWRAFEMLLLSMLQTRRTARELRGLSDHLLKDIGLHREEIHCVARRLAG